MSYSGDPSTSLRDQVRFYSQDTDEANELLSDDELDFLIKTWMPVTGSVLMTASVACSVIAAGAAQDVNYSADGVSLSAGDLQDKYLKLAQSLRDMDKSFSVGGGPWAGGVDAWDHIEPGTKPLHFATGMHDNIRAGEQDSIGPGFWYEGYFYPNDGYPTNTPGYVSP